MLQLAELSVDFIDSVLLIKIERLLLLESRGIWHRGLQAYQSGINLFNQLLFKTIELGSHIGLIGLRSISGIRLTTQHYNIFIDFSDQSCIYLFKYFTL